MQCMMIWNHLHKTNPKFVKNLSILKNPKFSKKSQKLGQKHEMQDKNREKKIILDEEMIFRPKNFWVWGLEWERKVWGGEKTKTIERDRGEMKKNCVDPLYRNPSFSMDREVLRAVEN